MLSTFQQSTLYVQICFKTQTITQPYHGELLSKGTIQILLPRANATTAVEQRRSNKFIWYMKGWQNGYYEVQGAGSQVIVQSVETNPGDSVVDYCAGNGGKTFA